MSAEEGNTGRVLDKNHLMMTSFCSESLVLRWYLDRCVGRTDRGQGSSLLLHQPPQATLVIVSI